MGCLVTLLARAALLGVWLATPLVSRAFGENWLLPLLGVLFLPVTALAYVLVYIPGIGVTGWAWAWVGLGFLFDLATHSAGAYSNRKRITGYRTS
jgi:hypothetical protein